MNDGTDVVDALMFVPNVIKTEKNWIKQSRLSKNFGSPVSNAVAERRWIRPIDLTKPFGPIKGEYDEIRSMFSHVFQLLNAYTPLG